ncbi:Uu.00g070770.m01.CDS01 [Anthostomella pinea]|uniref:Uu.00g070770.m01.CDS01 n=1 Tax=Anthostomella pinea TaxID=933095 RepID=A0AAI8VUS3_9PEZI|nr:Uu.00g070770.m01.CDS01 [Anthostomella pinea]
MDDDEEMNAEMAAAMGFSSFGGPKSNKRRKFNPGADAVVVSSATSTLPLHPQEATSGSNMTPLGVRNPNNDEIDLGLDEQRPESAADDGPADGEGQDPNGDDPEPQYLDTSRPSAPIATDIENEVQSKIDSILGFTPTQEYSSLSSLLPTRGGIGGRGGRGGHRANRGQDREQGKKWWEDYYDPNFNVNPWEHLERTKGLESRGSWMSWEESKATKG